MSAAAFLLRAAARPLATHPVQASGIGAFAILFGCVSMNAMFSQVGRHPNPIMATRANGDAAAMAVENDVAGLMPVPLVTEVQTALARAGYYTASLDGRPGPATAAAIRTYQSDHGLRVDGEASPKLLAAIRSAGRVAEADAAAPDPSQVASLSARGREETANDGQEVPDARPLDASPGKPDPDLVRRIQAGLSAAKIAELKADGIFGSQTEAAIRAFEASQGLDVTGAPDERLLARLRSIGAKRR